HPRSADAGAASASGMIIVREDSGPGPRNAARADPGRDRRIIPIRTSFPDQLLSVANFYADAQDRHSAGEGRRSSPSINPSKGSGCAEPPGVVIEPIEHCHALITGMSDNHRKALTGAGRCGHSRRWHLFGSGAAGGSLGQVRWRGSDALAAGDDEI